MEFLLSFDINVKFHLKRKLQRACKMQMLCTSRLSDHAGFRPRFNKFKSLRVLSINYTRVGTCTHRADLVALDIVCLQDIGRGIIVL